MEPIRNDFYLMLTSNASPITQPNNTSSHFINEYKDAIELDTSLRWRVALTELSYRFEPTTFSDKAAIRYHYINHVKFHYRDWDKFSLTKHANQPILEPMLKEKQTFVTVTLDNENKVVFKSQYHFMVDWWKEEEAQTLLGLSKYCVAQQKSDGYYYVKSTNSITVDKIKEQDQEKHIVHFKLHAWDHTTDMKTHYFPKNKTFDSIKDMINYIKSTCPRIFHSIYLDKDTKKVCFSLGPEICSVSFEGDLNYTLGFKHRDFWVSSHAALIIFQAKREATVYKASYLPKLFREMENMHIYANICKPMYVGHNYVPLLKNVFADSTDFSHYNALHVGNKKTLRQPQHPMYVDVATTSINRIEISICNETDDETVNFTDRSITSIILHFKCERPQT